MTRRSRQIRRWKYGNGRRRRRFIKTTASSRGRILLPLQSVALPYPLDFFTEPALFVGNTFYFPAGIFVEPIWKEQTYKSLSAPASYTLMPPLAAGPEPTPR